MTSKTRKRLRQKKVLMYRNIYKCNKGENETINRLAYKTQASQGTKMSEEGAYNIRN